MGIYGINVLQRELLNFLGIEGLSPMAVISNIVARFLATEGDDIITTESGDRIQTG